MYEFIRTLLSPKNSLYLILHHAYLFHISQSIKLRLVLRQQAHQNILSQLFKPCLSVLEDFKNTILFWNHYFKLDLFLNSLKKRFFAI